MIDKQTNAHQQSQNPPVGEVAEARGNIQAVTQDGTTRALQAGSPVFENDRIELSAGAQGLIAMNDGDQIPLSGDMIATIDGEVVGRDSAAARADAVAEAKELADLIAAGADPTQVLEAPAAGPAEEGGPDDAGEQTIFVVQRSGQEGIVESGFETIGLQQNFIEPEYPVGRDEGLLGISPTGPETPANLPPLTDDSSITVPEDGSLPLGLQPPTDPDQDALTIRVTELPDIGIITLKDGTPIRVGDELSEDQLTSLIFKAPKDYDNEPVGHFSYEVDDGTNPPVQGHTDIEVVPQNDDPQGTTLPDRTNLDAEVISLDVSGNFSDVDGDTLTYSANGLPTGLRIDPASGVISGTIDNSASQSGPFNVTVTATDPDGESAVVPFTWTVNNPGPDFVGETSGLDDDTYTFSAPEGTTAGTAIGTAGAVDPDNDTLTYSLDGVTDTGGNPVTGLFSINSSTGEISVSKDIDDAELGNYTLNVSTDDGEGGTDTATINVNLTNVNDAPEANDNDYSVNAGRSVTGNIITDNTGDDVDSDPEGDALTITHVNGSPVTFDPVTVEARLAIGDGSLIIEADGNYRYDHDGSAPAPTSFDYTISDGNGGSSTASVTLNIDAVPDSPILNVNGPSKTFMNVEDFQDVSINGSWSVVNESNAALPHWNTDNAGDNVEIGRETVYGGSDSSNLILELERNRGDASNIHQDVATRTGEVYRLDFDYSIRARGGDRDSSIEILQNGSQIDSITRGARYGDSFGFTHHTYTMVATAASTRFEIKALTDDSFGGILDNLQLEFIGYTEAADIPFDVIAANSPTDPTAALTVTIDNIRPGTVVSDGSNSFTASLGDTSVDISSWNMNTLTANFTGPGTHELQVTATSTDSNGDQASDTQTLSFDVLNADGSNNPTSDTGNTLTGTTGNDVLDGGEGSDTLLGGAGEDLLVHDAFDAMIDGGADDDTLLMDGTVSGLGSNVENIEAIDMTDGSNDDTLALTLSDVLDITDAENILTIDGDSGDQVDLAAADGWSARPTAPGDSEHRDGYSLYESGGAQLYVDNDVNVDIS